MPVEQAENDGLDPNVVAGALTALGRPQKAFEAMKPDEKLLVTDFIKAKQDIEAIKAELADFERQIEELEDRRLREMLWLPWPWYVR